MQDSLSISALFMYIHSDMLTTFKDSAYSAHSALQLHCILNSHPHTGGHSCNTTVFAWSKKCRLFLTIHSNLGGMGKAYHTQMRFAKTICTDIFCLSVIYILLVCILGKAKHEIGAVKEVGI